MPWGGIAGTGIFIAVVALTWRARPGRSLMVPERHEQSGGRFPCSGCSQRCEPARRFEWVSGKEVSRTQIGMDYLPSGGIRNTYSVMWKDVMPVSVGLCERCFRRRHRFMLTRDFIILIVLSTVGMFLLIDMDRSMRWMALLTCLTFVWIGIRKVFLTANSHSEGTVREALEPFAAKIVRSSGRDTYLSKDAYERQVNRAV